MMFSCKNIFVPLFSFFIILGSQSFAFSTKDIISNPSPEVRNILLKSTDTEPRKSKTFTVKVLGEVDSTITWNTASALGTLKANLMSHLKLDATSTVPDAKMKYILMGGILPPGLSLTINFIKKFIPNQLEVVLILLNKYL